MSTTSTNYTISPPLQTGQPQSPQASYMRMKETQDHQAKLGQVGGKRRRRAYYAKGGKIEVQTVTPIYTDAAGGTQGATAQQVGNQQLFATAMEQKSMDSKAASVPVQNGGSTTVLKPGQPWTSCYSGGKKSRKSNKSKKAKKSKKSKKSKKAKKTKKSRKSNK